MMSGASNESSLTSSVGVLIAAGAVAAYYFYCSRRSQQRPQEEREALRLRMQASAEARFASRAATPTTKMKNDRSNREKKTEKKDVESEGTVSNTLGDSVIGFDSSSGLRRPPKGPRKATLADEMKDREEKISNEQFGFSIYGNQEYCQSCGTNGAPTMVTSSSGASFGLGIHRVSAIPNIPGAHQALQELERLRTEFEPVVRARGWKVLLLTEMCCCGDGDGVSPPKGDAVLGYCVSANDNRAAHSIHLRLRPPGSCKSGLRLYPYEELVQTMVCTIQKRLLLFIPSQLYFSLQCHELAHIVVGPHNGHFFKVMAEIEREHAQELLNQGQTPHQFPGTGRSLGTI